MAFYSTYGQPFLPPYEDYEQDSALSSVNKPILWTSGSQPLVNPISDQLAGWTKFGLGVGALALFGRANIGKGRRGFDLYIGAARALEEYGPGRIFRTFQISHMLSPLEAASRQYRYWSPRMLRELRETPAGKTWLEHIERTTGQTFSGGSKLLEQGFRFENGKLLYGQTGSDVLLSHAGIIRSPMGVSPTLQEGIARSLAGADIKGLRSSLTQKIPYLTEKGDIASEAMFLVGGHTRKQAAGRFLAGYGTSLVERFNRLVAAPAEFYPKFFPGHGLINKIGKALSVEPSSGLKTFGKLGLKLGIGLPLAYAGYDLADWGVRQVLGKGITETAATLYTQGHVMLSRVAEWTGGHRLREWQEETAPGSTTLTRLAAFPIMGALAGATLGYAGRLARMGAYRLGGYSLQEASVMAGAEKSFMLKALYGDAIPEEMGALLTPATREMVENQTQRILSGWTGKIARGIAARQETGGFVGGLTKILGKVTPGKIRGLIGAGIGLGLVAPFIPGALVPGKRPEELEKIYSGKQLVPIRRGRWWEFGVSPWEGQRIDRFVPAWNVRLHMRARTRDLYGGKDLPLLYRLYKENMTYDIEEENYYRRPYPITAPAFSGVPLIGPILSATLGRIVKPPRLMHTEEMFREGPEGQQEIKEMPLRYGDRPAFTGLGELGSGMPISPYGVKGTISEQAYRLQEQVGLPGFTIASIKEAITGRQGLFDQEQRLQSAANMYGDAGAFYEEEMGGMAGLNEAFRRLFPRPRKIPEWNAIPNEFANVSWLPGEGDRSPNFRVGDPYRAIPHGELRLPGPMYERLHPELAGLNPNEYSAMARYRILADIAPYSDKFKEASIQVATALKYKELTKEEEAEVKEIKSQIRERKERKQFWDYKYKDKSLTPVQEVLTAANEASKGDKGPSWFQSVVGGYWETLAHNAETPMEYATPFSPASKFVHMRTATEDYERNIYGTESRFWQHPIRDFLRPFLTTTAHSLGWQGVPESVERRREIEEYFDILKYMKFTRLKNAAQMSGNIEASDEFESRRRETLFGINPFTMNYKQVFRALPRRERDYYNAFMKADMEERAKIVDMVPENEKAFYIARWQQQDSQDIKKAISKGLLTDKQLQEAEAELKRLYEQRETEGMPKDQDLWAEYLATRTKGESYPDWYRRTKLLEERLGGRDLPGPNWVGWHPAVMLDDVKLKVIESLGENPIDYDIWPDQQRTAAKRPYLEAAAQGVPISEKSNHIELQAKIKEILAYNKITADQVAVIPITGASGNRIDINLSESRDNEIREMVRRGKLIN